MFGKRGGTAGGQPPLAMPPEAQRVQQPPVAPAGVPGQPPVQGHPAPQQPAPNMAPPMAPPAAPHPGGAPQVAHPGMQPPQQAAPTTTMPVAAPQKKIKAAAAPPKEEKAAPANEIRIKSEEYYDVKTQVFSALIDTIDLSQLSKLDRPAHAKKSEISSTTLSPSSRL